jgi:hypothetical protein
LSSDIFLAADGICSTRPALLRAPLLATVSAGGFVRRVARTPHYDGAKKDGNEPAVIGLFGIGPVQFELVDSRKPRWRQL